MFMPFIQDVKKDVSKEQLQKNYKEAKKNLAFCNLVQKLELTDSEAMKMTSKIQDTILELEHCKHCNGLYECQNSLEGHVLFPEKKEENIYFSYIPCKYQKAAFKKRKEREKKASANLTARMRDIDFEDKKRSSVIKWIDQFFSAYDYGKEMKGLYLHGSFGSGKTFLISALFHELETSFHVSPIIVYFPEALRSLKDDWEMFERKMRQYQTADLLLLDDIGAEKVTEWGRDEVLGTILQYRMEHALPTFFTSNMNLEQLERHLANTGSNVDAVKARRIIERIKQLATPMELISENRRK